MRGLFFKIFVIFWIAQSLIFVISTAVIINRRSPRPDFLFSAIFDSIRDESSQAALMFESGGCAEMNAVRRPPGKSVALEDETGRVLCGSSIPAVPGDLSSASQI